MNPTPYEIERHEELRRLPVATRWVAPDARVRCARCKSPVERWRVVTDLYGVDYCSVDCLRAELIDAIAHAAGVPR